MEKTPFESGTHILLEAHPRKCRKDDFGLCLFGLAQIEKSILLLWDSGVYLRPTVTSSLVDRTTTRFMVLPFMSRHSQISWTHSYFVVFCQSFFLFLFLLFYFAFCLFVFVFFPDTTSLCRSGCPGTCSVEQSVFHNTEIHMSLTPKS